MVKPGRAFYIFPRVPHGTGTEFVTEAIRNKLLSIPGGAFSRRDTHFRLSYAAERPHYRPGMEILDRLAREYVPARSRGSVRVTGFGKAESCR